MTEKRFRYYEEENGEFPFPYIKDSDGKDIISLYQCYECMNALHEENQELRQDNDIKFWKHQFMTQHNSTQLILHELSLAMNEGYEVSDKFKEWLDDLTEKNKEVITKH